MSEPPSPETTLDWSVGLPAEWEVREMGREVWVRARLGWKGLTADEYVSEGIPMLATPNIKDEDIDYAGANKISLERYQESPEIMLKDGDVLLTKDGSTIGTVNTVRRLLAPATVNGSIAVLTPTGNLDGRFLYWFLASAYAQALFDRLRGGMGVPHLFQRDINRIRIPIPPPDEQRSIADFLDRETARIDELIAEQRRLVDLLHERRRAVLDEVTSAVIGERIKLKHLFNPSSVANCTSEEVLSVYRDYGVIPKASRVDNFNRTPENLERYLLVRPGDLVVNRMKAWQGSLGISEYRGIVSGDYEVARPVSEGLLPRFAHYFLRSPRMIAEYAERSTGIRPSQWRLYWEQMGQIEMPVPEIETQQEQMDRLEEQLARIDLLTLEAERLIDLAREHRAALITAAVTGQIDVRSST